MIGTNKKDAQETVDNLFADLDAGRIPDREPEGIEALLDERDPRHVTWEGWSVIDEAEKARGEPHGRPRIKFSSVDEMHETARGGKPASA